MSYREGAVQAWDPRPRVLVLEDRGQQFLCPRAVLVLVVFYDYILVLVLVLMKIGHCPHEDI